MRGNGRTTLPSNLMRYCQCALYKYGIRIFLFFLVANGTVKNSAFVAASTVYILPRNIYEYFYLSAFFHIFSLLSYRLALNRRVYISWSHRLMVRTSPFHGDNDEFKSLWLHQSEICMGRVHHKESSTFVKD